MTDVRLWIVVVATLAPLPLAGQGSVRGTVWGPASLQDERAVVHLETLDGPAPPVPMRPDTVLIDQAQLRFLPDLVAIPAGGTVHFLNSDPVMHNVFSPRRSASFDLGTYPAAELRSHTFENPGQYVMLCHVHPEMVAWVVVVPSPYVAVTDDSGAFSLDGVPPGRYVLRAWSRRTGGLERTIDVPAGGIRGVAVELKRRGPVGGGR